MLGITFGFGVLLALCAFGIGELVVALPQLVIVLKALAVPICSTWPGNCAAWAYRARERGPADVLPRRRCSSSPIPRPG
jgi:hypothetical protein